MHLFCSLLYIFCPGVNQPSNWLETNSFEQTPAEWGREKKREALNYLFFFSFLSSLPQLNSLPDASRSKQGKKGENEKSHFIPNKTISSHSFSFSLSPPPMVWTIAYRIPTKMQSPKESHSSIAQQKRWRIDLSCFFPSLRLTERELCCYSS